MAADLGAVLPQLRAGHLKAVALVSGKRSTIVPDVPTAGELGLAGMDLIGWIGVAGPAGLAPDAMRWWTDQLTATMAAPAVLERLRAMGTEPDLVTGDAFQQFVQAQHEAWGRQIRQMGLQPE